MRGWTGNDRVSYCQHVTQRRKATGGVDCRGRRAVKLSHCKPQSGSLTTSRARGTLLPQAGAQRRAQVLLAVWGCAPLLTAGGGQAQLPNCGAHESETSRVPTLTCVKCREADAVRFRLRERRGLPSRLPQRSAMKLKRFSGSPLGVRRTVSRIGNRAARSSRGWTEARSSREATGWRAQSEPEGDWQG